LNAAPTNRRNWCKEQLRESANYGGLYFLLDVFDLKITLTSNAGETDIGNSEKWPYYAHVSNWERDHDWDDASRGYLLLAAALTHAGVAVEVEYGSPPKLT
jgi:hypothetical protein